ncbi:NAD(P)-dependent oxidoreductase [Pseudofulvibacter geojedonensis]|uniref:NAD(P)-dependent oxidoreductase n=1 Tax=Pseudofulvibacter geojedonensis TaxID=1123758 RepID=A0ABW3HZ37_9FLAO
MERYITHISGIDEISSATYAKLHAVSDIKYISISNHLELKKALNECDIFWFRLNHQLTRDILKDVNCKYIICAATGLDHIDINACKEFGIQVISLKGESEFLKEVRATAEHTIGLLLTLIRKSKNAYKHTEQGNWNRYLFQGSELYKKSIGILGLGRLGKIVAEYASVFGMEVYYFDTTEQNVPYHNCKTIEELFEKVDVLSIHLPYNEENHFIVNKSRLNLMKPNAYIVNTARGGLVNENDLIEKLNDNSLAGYATDVLYGEPNISEHPLIEYAKNNNNVIITPHIGGNTYESIEKTESFVVDKILDIIKK